MVKPFHPIEKHTFCCNSSLSLSLSLSLSHHCSGHYDFIICTHMTIYSPLAALSRKLLNLCSQVVSVSWNGRFLFDHLCPSPFALFSPDSDLIIICVHIGVVEQHLLQVITWSEYICMNLINLDVIFFLEESYSGIWLLLLLMQIFKTHLLFCLTIILGAPEGNKFLFANENKLVKNSWPPSVAKLLGRHALTVKTGEEHK